jgi:hypothetical protein
VGRTGVPAPVRRFISGHIESVAQLEVLLLARAVTDKAWTAEEVARALVIRPESAAHWLDDLAARGLLLEDGGRYRYHPSTDGTESTIDDLAESYAKYRVAVIGLIFSKPSERVTVFADAFRIRRRRD